MMVAAFCFGVLCDRDSSYDSQPSHVMYNMLNSFQPVHPSFVKFIISGAYCVTCIFFFTEGPTS